LRGQTLQDIRGRDERDRSRAGARLKAADDAIELDTSQSGSWNGAQR
jgi:cytidylate kinase